MTYFCNTFVYFQEAWWAQVRDFKRRSIHIISLTWDFLLYLELWEKTKSQRIRIGQEDLRQYKWMKMLQCSTLNPHISHDCYYSHHPYINTKLSTMNMNSVWCLPACDHNFAIATLTYNLLYVLVMKLISIFLTPTCIFLFRQSHWLPFLALSTNP